MGSGLPRKQYRLQKDDQLSQEAHITPNSPLSWPERLSKVCKLSMSCGIQSSSAVPQETKSQVQAPKAPPAGVEPVTSLGHALVDPHGSLIVMGHGDETRRSGG
jgi:hypothetical protein